MTCQVLQPNWYLKGRFPSNDGQILVFILSLTQINFLQFLICMSCRLTVIQIIRKSLRGVNLLTNYSQMRTDTCQIHPPWTNKVQSLWSQWARKHWYSQSKYYESRQNKKYWIHLHEKYDVCACVGGKSYRRIHIRELSNAPCWLSRIGVDSGQKFCFISGYRRFTLS